VRFSESPDISTAPSNNGGFAVTLVRRIFVSLPSERALSPRPNAFKLALFNELKKLEERGYRLETLSEPSLPGGNSKPWSAAILDNVLRQCVGAVIVGLPRWEGTFNRQRTHFTSEYLHFEGAVMHTLGLPVLALLDPAVGQRGFFHGDQGFLRIREMESSWLASTEFRNAFGHWLAEIEARSDVFLAYSSGAKNEQIVAMLHAYLSSLGVKVLDWKSGFESGDSIYESLAKSVSNCSAGVFLMTKDDELKSGQYVPRDNVVFEAGLFCHAKGRRRALLLIEKDTKKPSDLDGVIHVNFEEPFKIDEVKKSIDSFVSQNL
jgi:hypothetical protein